MKWNQYEVYELAANEEMVVPVWVKAEHMEQVLALSEIWKMSDFVALAKQGRKRKARCA